MHQPELNLHEMVLAHAHAEADRCALIESGRPVSYGALRAAVLSVSELIDAAGVPADAVVAVRMNRGWFQVAALLAVIESGRVAAPVNPALAVREISDYLEVLRPGGVLVDAEHASTGGAGGAIEMVGLQDAGAGALDRGLRSWDGDRPAIAFSTGGTTGAPKAVLWTHAGLTRSTVHQALAFQRHRDDCEVYSAPLFHNAIVSGLLATLAVGGRAHVLPRFDARAVVDLIDDGATTMFAVPTQLVAMLDVMGPGARLGLEKLVVGAAHVSEQLIERLRGVFPAARLFSGYGLSEAGGTVSFASDAELSAGRTQGVGLPLPGVRVRVHPHDTDPGTDGSVGELEVRSPFQGAGYVNRPDETAQTWVDGWVRTGDTARLSADGWITILGRRKDTARSGGETIYFSEVEDAVIEHPRVTAAAAFSLSDEKWGDRVEIAVVVDGEAELTLVDLQAHLAPRLTRFKWPKAVHAVSELPTTPMGKLDRAALVTSIEARG